MQERTKYPDKPVYRATHFRDFITSYCFINDEESPGQEIYKYWYGARFSAKIDSKDTQELLFDLANAHYWFFREKVIHERVGRYVKNTEQNRLVFLLLYNLYNCKINLFPGISGRRIEYLKERTNKGFLKPKEDYFQQENQLLICYDTQFEYFVNEHADILYEMTSETDYSGTHQRNIFDAVLALTYNFDPRIREETIEMNELEQRIGIKSMEKRAEAEGKIIQAYRLLFVSKDE